MNPIPNKLMPWVQALAAGLLLGLFCVLATGPMFGLKPADPSLVETEKAVVLILVGFLFGTSVGSAKKDDQAAALTAQIVAAPVPPAPTTPPAEPTPSFPPLP